MERTEDNRPLSPARTTRGMFPEFWKGLGFAALFFLSPMLVVAGVLPHHPIPVLLLGASAAAFGFVHIVFGNWIAVALSFVGGLLFYDTYKRSRSLYAVSIEHALYGCLIFTLGIGYYFYHGNVRWG